MTKQRVVVVVGPTSSGKSYLAIALAKQFSGEVISADSRQVYSGMDIGTGKVPKDHNSPQNEYRSDGIRHYLLDVADPTEQFTVSDYKNLAATAIKEVAGHGKLPIICGGTGFYVDALIFGYGLPNALESLPKMRPFL